MKKLIPIVIGLLIVGCQSNKNVNKQSQYSKSDIVNVHDIGTVCYRRIKPKVLDVVYTAHNADCISSSTFENHYSISVTPYGGGYNIEVNGYYIKKHPQIALTDCDGAGVQDRRVKLLSDAPITIRWNGDKLGVLPTNSSEIYCYKRDGKQLVKYDGIKRFIKNMPK